MATVTVRINGMEYNLKGKEDEAYLKQLASYVEEKLQEILNKNNKLSVSAASVLTAINLADDSFKSKKETNNFLDDNETLKAEIKVMNKEIIMSNSNKEKAVKVKEIEMKAVIDNLKGRISKEIKLKELAEKEIVSSKEVLSVLISEKTRLEQEKVELQEELHEEIQNSSNDSSEEIALLRKQISLIEKENIDLKKRNVMYKNSSRDSKFELQSCKYRMLDLENKYLEGQITIATEKAKNNKLIVKKIK
ncbi:cell division protein ZapA [uncultured Clostridium sp.]|uniref:cell division protein ZapA n=1 Tax=uncultured Clostridium sp. TaxID=59620 RepID=UPI0026071EAC|nr:cell division protein ZapA [uncultured Clostridium sp.]